MQLAHEDARRSLYSFPEAKVIVAKTDTTIGGHYHKLKEEVFILSEGSCVLWTPFGGAQPMAIGKLYAVPPETYHEFHLTQGSVLIGLNSRIYDASDDYRGENHVKDN